jgi:ABC-2 type transport system permease protein
MTTATGRPSLRARLGRMGTPSPGITAILVKELRGRMRGRRTYVVLTLYLLLLAGFSWMIAQQSTSAVQMSGCFDSRFGGFCGGSSALYMSPTIGRGIFVGLILLLTLVVTLLSPAFTASAISGEREHQTLDLLAATPITSLAIVLGKLVSSLAWIFLLILASIPITALVFVFGGVGPEDLVRAYVILFATAIGLGSIGLFFSALFRRSVAATGVTTLATVAIMGGTVFVYAFLLATGGYDGNGMQRRPAESILYLNSFVAQADVACDASSGSDGLCSVMNTILGSDLNLMPPAPVPAVKVGVGGVVTGDAVGAVAPADVAPSADQAIAVVRDRFWPRTVVAWLVIALVLVALSVQSISTTRRWRIGWPRFLGRRRGTAA